jgi:hypothetical protein
MAGAVGRAAPPATLTGPDLTMMKIPTKGIVVHHDKEQCRTGREDGGVWRELVDVKCCCLVIAVAHPGGVELNELLVHVLQGRHSVRQSCHTQRPPTIVCVENPVLKTTTLAY